LEIDGQPKLAISPGTPKIDAGYFTTKGVLLLAEASTGSERSYRIPRRAVQ